MSPFPSSPGHRNPPWRYGVYVFPIGPVLLLLSRTALELFVQASEAGSLAIGLSTFAVTLIAGWSSVLCSAVVAVALVMDALALRDHPYWNPNPWLAGVVGIGHLAGAELAYPYLLSVPAIGYYVYRRRQHIGGDGGSGPGPADPSGDRPALES
ncbi:hypothetical protein [Natrinema salsiterrestre]|uniref:Uncharacterized protein n=1 Tax=Natrinema salsiterrestre TaxID=2950540 RepID=A0A9Q4PZG1_9EURY|nr:hypothetical protein [Natrinema salsiterrestre]MDF9744149.1 hypothetical protein [Natrinema salsiterrestre]